VRDHRRRADHDREAQRQRFGLDLERAKPRALLRHARGRRNAGGTRGPLRVHLLVPFAELPLQVLLVEEAPLLEEGTLHPTDQVLDRTLTVSQQLQLVSRLERR